MAKSLQSKKKVRQIISELEWDKIEDFKQAETTWRVFKNWIMQEIEKRPDLKDSYRYQIEKIGVLKRHGDAYEAGEPICFNETYRYIIHYMKEKAENF
ncbi:hypothetical protein COT75_05380 [Candidatus Beckwithbacteria bacterium CG10_big_fil_rev_8_21_14_0_10_34_10]|uniref:Uncharacterized protein n=1 Tax=Candidatus Beckwithbacteria bacterium CG10_big_fil_rev_8_21_14_0_10_34_10 TaxID=1974495 RepID=A0A2H0W7R3_9BACT|nr:MAG: hypothetical protein COT75_05380 [Candidatus Beckwithbacteria bacterium CG10_big_fil_rev_8_21_14_0_10_34_10]